MRRRILGKGGKLHTQCLHLLGEGGAAQGWVLRVWHKPLVPWLWAGFVIMGLGGLVSLSDRRLRIGAPERQRSPAAAPAGAD